jgi:hypothetical protein
VGLLGCDGDVAADLGRGDVDGAGGFVEAIDGEMSRTASTAAGLASRTASISFASKG